MNEEQYTKLKADQKLLREQFRNAVKELQSIPEEYREIARRYGEVAYDLGRVKGELSNE